MYFTLKHVSIWTSHMLNAQQPCVSGGLHTGQSRFYREHGWSQVGGGRALLPHL